MLKLVYTLTKRSEHKMKRGRPRTKIESKDFGTPELIKKREQLLTTEPLDLLLYKKLITEKQHRAGLHFRWLYSICFEPAHIKAHDPGRVRGKFLRESYDEDFLVAIKEEYYRAIKKLKRIRAEGIVCNICIYQELPRFIANNNSCRGNNFELQTIRNGLDLLSNI